MDMTTKVKWLYLSKVKKIGDTNNVEVTFSGFDSPVTPPPVIIGRKALVILLDEIADEYEKTKIEFPVVYAHARELAQKARANLWPKSV